MPDSVETLETEVTEEVVTPEEEKKSVIDTIKTKISNFFNGEEQEESKQVEIPETFKTAVAGKWDEDTLNSFVMDESGKPKFTEQQLLEMIPYLTGKAEDAEESSDDTSDNADQLDAKKDKAKVAEDKVKDSQEDDRIAKLEKQIADLLAEKEKGKEIDEQVEFDGMVQTATSMMDEASKSIEVLGTFKDLPRFPDGSIIPSSPQMKAREEVWGVAYALQQTGMDIKKAMLVSLNAYKGQHLEKSVHQKVVKDLRSNAKKLSPKRTTKEQTEEYESGVDVIRATARKHGIEMR